MHYVDVFSSLGSSQRHLDLSFVDIILMPSSQENNLAA